MLNKGELLNKVVAIRWEKYEFEMRIVKLNDKGITLIAEENYISVFSKPIYVGDIMLCVTGSIEGFMGQAKTGIVNTEDFGVGYRWNLEKVCSKY